MSWSYDMTGKAQVVRNHAEGALEQSERSCSIPSEARSIRAFARALDAVCESARDQCVRAEGSGSAWYENGKLKSFQFHASIEVFDMSES